MKMHHTLLIILAGLCSISVYADNASYLEDLQKACKQIDTCKSIDHSTGSISITCTDGSSGYIYLPAPRIKQDSGPYEAHGLGYVATGTPNTGSYYCVANHAPHLHPENMIKKFCDKQTNHSNETEPN